MGGSRRHRPANGFAIKKRVAWRLCANAAARATAQKRRMATYLVGTVHAAYHKSKLAVGWEQALAPRLPRQSRSHDTLQKNQVLGRQWRRWRWQEDQQVQCLLLIASHASSAHGLADASTIPPQHRQHI